MKKNFLFLGLTALIVFVLLSLNFQRERLEIQYELSLADANQPAFALIYLAEELGYFEEEALELSYERYTSGRDALNAAIEGEVDLATVFETPVAIQLLNAQDISVISELHQSSENNGILARRDAGIESVNDLAGKTIAVTQLSGAEFFAHIILGESGVQVDEVTWVDAAPQDMVSLFTSGAVDAIATWNPHIINARNALGEEEVVQFHALQARELSVLAGLTSTIETKQAALSAMLKALVRAEAYYFSNQELANQMIVEHFPDEVPSTVSSIIEGMDYGIYLSNTLLSSLFEESVWYELQEEYDVDLGVESIQSHLDGSFLEAIDVTRVTLLPTSES
jgi:ABC-type nitrate/sulfonate/bicarbonate transport system substrate-binding protein